ncbi:MAG: hypothetical protein ACT4O9_01890, partial [Blastocatellia bacterium]
MRVPKAFYLCTIAVLTTVAAYGQQTNPVDRQVANPITDTPNINPISAAQDISAPKIGKSRVEKEGGDGDLVVYSEKQTVEGEEGKRVLVHTGNVDARYGIYRMQADKITIIEAENKMIVEGS